MTLRFHIDPKSKISLITNTSPKNISADDSLRKASEHAIKQRRLPVLTKTGSLVGILTHSDIIKTALEGASPQTRSVAFMSDKVVSSNKSHTIEDVLANMKVFGVGGMPVLSSGKFFGMIGERDFIGIMAADDDYTVGDLMTKKPFCLDSSYSIIDSVKSMMNVRYRRFPIVEKRKVVGIVTSHDILKHLKKVDYDVFRLDGSITSIMTGFVITLNPNDGVSKAIKLMRGNSVGGLPVLDEGKLVGILTENDLLNKPTH